MFSEEVDYNHFKLTSFFTFFYRLKFISMYIHSPARFELTLPVTFAIKQMASWL